MNHLVRSAPPATRSCVRLTWLATALAVILPAVATAQPVYLVNKTQFYRQTSAASPTPDPVRPFQFDASAPVNFTLSLPSGAAAPGIVHYDAEDEEFQLRPVFATKAALDAAFPSGTYRMSGPAMPAVSLAVSEAYPVDGPRVTQVTNGTWNAGGVLVVNPTQACTITLGSFTDFAAAGGAGLVIHELWGYQEQDNLLEVYAASQPLLDFPVQASAPNTITIPANRMANNRLYHVTIEFIRLPSLDPATIPGALVAGLLTKRLDFFIAAQTNATPAAAPVVVTSPASRTVAAGSTTTFTANLTVPEAARGNIALIYKDGEEVRFSPRVVRAPSGQAITVNAVNLADAGNYVFEVVSAGGIARTEPATLTVPVAAGLPRLSNLSILTTVAAGEAFTLGYVTGGAGTTGAKPLVIRAVGPSLAQLGVTGVLDDPRLELFAGSTRTGENDNWGGAADLSAAMAGVGAFAFSGPASRDAAVLANIASPDNSVRISGTGAGTGTVIAEIYDATPSASFSAATPRLLNVSVLKNVGTGLTAGFVIGGGGAKNVLIRAIGPTLAGAPFNVSGVLADPQLALFSGSFRIAENNNWGGATGLATTFSQVGAFALPATSRDAALIATLAPGNYTVQVSGVGNATGTALVEVYELP